MGRASVALLWGLVMVASMAWMAGAQDTTTPQPAPQVPVASPSAAPEVLIKHDPKLIEQGYPPAAVIKARHEYELERGIRFPKLVRGNPDIPAVALTFDDGPHPKFTLRLLEVLKRERVRATFFVVGSQVDLYPGLVQQEVAEGHEVANHTYHHLRLASVPKHLIEPELVDGVAAIKRATGSSVRLYRPPGGEYDKDVIDATKKLGYVMVLWTDDPGDFTSPGSKIIESRVLRDVENGAIILLHDGIQQTLDILPDLIARLKSKGFQFKTCTEMAMEKGVLKSGGPEITPESMPSPKP